MLRSEERGSQELTHPASKTHSLGEVLTGLPLVCLHTRWRVLPGSVGHCPGSQAGGPRLPPAQQCLWQGWETERRLSRNHLLKELSLTSYGSIPLCSLGSQPSPCPILTFLLSPWQRVFLSPTQDSTFRHNRPTPKQFHISEYDFVRTSK